MVGLQQGAHHLTFKFMGTETTIYLLAFFIILYMYRARKTALEKVSYEAFPELEKPVFFEFKRLLDEAFERMLYLAGAFLVLAIASYFGVTLKAKIVFFLVLIGTFVANIPPRNRIFKFLEAYSLSIESLKKRGIKL